MQNAATITIPPISKRKDNNRTKINESLQFLLITEYQLELQDYYNA
jgi:hypothetical protein